MPTTRWFSPAALVVVILGGMIGVAIRAVIVLPLGSAGLHPLVIPAVTLAINLLGSMLLGVIVGWLADRHPIGRLFLGTGVMGGFTTYSAFAVQALTTSAALPLVGIVLIALSVFGGVFLAVVGLAIGRRLADRPDEIERPEDAE